MKRVDIISMVNDYIDDNINPDLDENIEEIRPGELTGDTLKKFQADHAELEEEYRFEDEENFVEARYELMFELVDKLRNIAPI